MGGHVVPGQQHPRGAEALGQQRSQPLPGRPVVRTAGQAERHDADRAGCTEGVPGGPDDPALLLDLILAGRPLEAGNGHLLAKTWYRSGGVDNAHRQGLVAPPSTTSRTPAYAPGCGAGSVT